MRCGFGFILFLLISFSFAAGASANSCEDIDLRKSKCLPPQKSQSDTEFCYAYSAAEAVSFRFCREVSPAALGLMVGQTAKPEDKDQNFWSIIGSSPLKAIDMGNKNGYCLESEFPSQILQNDVALELRKEYLSLLKKSEASALPCAEMSRRVAEVLPTADIKNIVAFISEGQTPEALMKLAFSRCKNPIKEKVETKTCAGDDKAKLKFVRENLSRGPIALTVKDDTPGVQTVGAIENVHSVSIIGQKMEDGVCKFLIRDPGQYPKFENGVKVGYKDRVDGWISEEMMLETLQHQNTRCYSVH